MNSNFGRSTTSQRGGGSMSSSLNNFDFDLGLSKSRPRSLNDQKLSTSSSYSHSSSSSSNPQTKPTSSWQPNRPSWTHQPAAPAPSTRPGEASAPSSMVGDIFGKSWASASPSSDPVAAIGIANKNPSLFGDLLGPALGQGKSNSNVPLKNAAPVSSKSSYSMANLDDSLPKVSNPVKSGSSSWGSSESFGSFTGSSSSSYSNHNHVKSVSPNIGTGGPTMRNLGGSGMGANKDPFVSLVDLGSKKAAGGVNSAGGGVIESSKINTGSDPFGDFQKAPREGTPLTNPSYASPVGSITNNNGFTGSRSNSSSGVDDFGIASKDYASQKQPPAQPTGVDPLDSLFTPASASTGADPAASQGAGNQQFSELDDWGTDSEFGGLEGGSTTTELEGLPPPPAGVSASSAMNKGMDNQKQGQYADAIKWLSWSLFLFEKAGNGASTMDALSCRASCYKEVGEYKKAVADCTKVLELDRKNVAVLVQRALLYESMEKYKLGAEDLRTVMKLDPLNRVARSTIHRLTKLAQ